MKTKNKFRLMSLLMVLLLVALTATPSRSMAASQLPVNLGTTSTFAVIAGSTITNTGATTINGDVGADIGLYPGTEFTGKETVTLDGGAIYIADAVALQAKNDLVVAYNDAESRTPVTRIPSELGGSTLTPGTYDSADGTFQITGTLTLDAQGDPEGVFVFKTASTLITAAGSNIVMTNSARFCRTFWMVGSSATLGINSHFVGHILAMVSITATTGATVQGQLLAQTGAVTLDNNTITNGICDVITTPIPTITPTPIPTIIPTPTPTITPTPTPTITPTPTPTITPTPTPTITPTPVPTITPTPSASPTIIPVQVVETSEDDIPKTGSFPTEILFGLGALITGAGLFINKKKK